MNESYRKPAECPSRLESLCVELSQVAYQHALEKGQAGKDSVASDIAVVMQNTMEGWAVQAIARGGNGSLISVLHSKGVGATPEEAVLESIKKLKNECKETRWREFARQTHHRVRVLE